MSYFVSFNFHNVYDIFASEQGSKEYKKIYSVRSTAALMKIYLSRSKITGVKMCSSKNQA